MEPLNELLAHLTGLIYAIADLIEVSDRVLADLQESKED